MSVIDAVDALDDLVKWTSLALPLVLAVSTLIAVMVHRFTRRRAQMETLKLVNSRWRDINLGTGRE